MAQGRLEIAFLGHVDHGKSTLIGRLLCDTGSVPPDVMKHVRLASERQGLDMELAFLMDHLREEREQRLTIDTAQVFLRTVERDYVMIDAPGHRELLKNMLTGASQAEAAILVVDAREGLGEQTRRHAFLLTLLGIQRCAVAINKMDLVGFARARFEECRDAVSQFLTTIGLGHAPSIPVSARLGDNVVGRSERMAWYDGATLLEVLEGIPVTKETALPARFCVQDVYHFDDRRLVAGRVESGKLAAGAQVMVLPDRLMTEVLSIERFQSDRTVAEAGECVAVTLPGELEARRGQVLCEPDALPAIASHVHARLFWMSNTPLKSGDSLVLKVSTQEATCWVAGIERRIDSSSLDVLEEGAGRLENAEVGELDLVLCPPIVAEVSSDNPSLGRIVLERDGAVVAAGVIVDLDDTGLQG